MEDLNLPEIKRKKAEEKKADKKEFKGLFESDSDDDDDDGWHVQIQRQGFVLIYYLVPVLQLNAYVIQIHVLRAMGVLFSCNAFLCHWEATLSEDGFWNTEHLNPTDLLKCNFIFISVSF